MAEKDIKVNKGMSAHLRFQKALSEIPAIPKNRTNGFLKNKYYNISDLVNTVKPIFAAHGLGFSQPATNLVCPVRGIIPALRTVVWDGESGEILMNEIFPLNLENQTSQGVGSIFSYFRRYCADSMLGLEGEDDDGNAASGVVAPKGKTETLAKPVKAATPKVNINKPPFGEGADENEDVLADIIS